MSIRWNRVGVLCVLMAFAVCITGSLMGADATNAVERGIPIDISKAPRLDAGRATLTGQRKTQPPKKNLLRAWKDDEVFLNVGGWDIVKWRLIREMLEDSLSQFAARKDIPAEGLEDARQMAVKMKLQNTLKRYIFTAVLADEAKRLGLRATKEDLEHQRARDREYYRRKGRVGERGLKRMSQPESFYEHNLTNGVLFQAYVEKIVRPSIKVLDEEISACRAAQHATNELSAATNVFKRTLIYDLARKVKGGLFGWGRMDFSVAAEKWSDCTTSDTGGVFTDADENPQRILPGDLHPALEAVYKTLKPGETSEVVETPYSWHVLKLLARHPASGDKPETVELAHIMLEKVLPQPELSEEQGRHLVSDMHLKRELNSRFAELVKKAKIECKIPLLDSDAKKGKKGKGKKQ